MCSQQSKLRILEHTSSASQALYPTQQINDNFDSLDEKNQRRSDYKDRCSNRRDRSQVTHKKERRRTTKYVCQSNLTTLPALPLSALSRFVKFDVSDPIIREIEGLILLFTTLSYQTATEGIVGVVLTWAQGRCPKSILGSFTTFIQGLFQEEKKKTAQSNATNNPDWLECLRDTRTNWEMCKSNKAFKQVSKLLGCLVTLGLCEQSQLTFSIGQFKLFEPQLYEKHVTAFNLFDAIFDTITFFVEGAYLCFKEGSIRPFLVNDRTAMEMDAEFAQIVQWFDLVRNGNLGKFSNITDQEFEVRMNRLGKSLSALASSLHGIEKKIVLDKYTKILLMQNDFVNMKVSSGVRHSPWAVSLFGESSQGKTTLGDQLVDALLVSQGLPVGKEYRCAFNAGDKFMSNWTSDKLVMIFDDMSNDKSNFVERPPTRALIDVINNQMFYAPKAELEAKGKCFVEPWIVVATTNVKDLDARSYSNCPYSVQRRLISLTVRAKAKFQIITDGVACGIDSTKVREHYTKDGNYEAPMFDDIWEIDVERAVKPESLTSAAKYEPVIWQGKPLSGISMAQCIQWAIEDFDVHRLNQAALLTSMRGRVGTMKKCHVEGCKHLEGNCPYHAPIEAPNSVCVECDDKKESDNKVSPYDYEKYLSIGLDKFKKWSTKNEEAWTNWFNALQKENPVQGLSDKLDVPCADNKPHFGLATVNAATKLWYASSIVASAETLADTVDSKAAGLLYNKGMDFINKFDWIQAIPAPVLHDPKTRPFMKWWYKDTLDLEYSRTIWRIGYSIVLVIFFTFILSSFSIAFTCGVGLTTIVVGMFTTRNLYERIENELVDELKRRNMELAPMVRAFRDAHANTLLATVAGLSAVYALARAYKAFMTKEIQSPLSPTSLAEVQKRDAQPNVWTSVVRRPLPISDVSKRMSSDHLMNCVTKCLVHGVIDRGEGLASGIVNCLFIRTNVMLMPDHYFTHYGDAMDCTFRKKNPDASGGKFRIVISKVASYLVPHTDLRLCYVPMGGEHKDLSSFFPVETFTGKIDKLPFRLFYRNKLGEIQTAKGVVKPGMTQTRDNTRIISFDGGDYSSLEGMDTFGGMCGAPLVSDTNGSVIMGVHLGGVEGTPKGCYGSLIQSDIKAGLEYLRSLEGVILPAAEGEFQTEILGKNVLTKGELHNKSPLNYMPHDSQVTYYGTCIGRSVSVSSATVTPVSEHVMDVCGVPNIYHGPKFKPEYWGWQQCLANLANPASPFPFELLQVAVVDYKSALMPIFKSEIWNKTAPLDDVTNLSGEPGTRFIDAIKLSTSIGFPLTGAKRNFVRELDPTLENPCNREFDSIIMNEITRIEECYKKGERGYPIAKACKKDEVLSGEKCRIFYSNAISLTYLIRKYFLPIMRVLQMNPLLSECAVGINSHGPEWEELHQYVTKFGMDRLIGGDYGKYDQKLPSQVIFASLRILIDFASVCDYTKEDLAVMEALTADLVYAYIAFNGDLIGITQGTHISGNSLTVIINGICGALNLRCYFFSQYPPYKGVRRNFRDCVALSTYGDDNIGSVVKGIEKFTIKGCSEFLGSYGQIYTMPDKLSELTDYLPPSELEFLKRTSVYIPELGVHLGALKSKSIYKSLHCYLAEKNSPITPLHASALNIEGAMREWFNHGREIYEKQRTLMDEVARRSGIHHMCAEVLDRTFDDMVCRWRETYLES